MAEKPKKQEEAPAEVVEETKGGSKKVLLIVVAIMVIENDPGNDTYDDYLRVYSDDVQDPANLNDYIAAAEEEYAARGNSLDSCKEVMKVVVEDDQHQVIKVLYKDADGTFTDHDPSQDDPAGTSGSGSDQTGDQVVGLLGAAALAVDGGRAGLLGQPGGQPGHPGDVVGLLAELGDAPADDLFDLAGIDPGLVHEGLLHRPEQLGGVQSGEPPVAFADRAAGGLDDHGSAHAARLEHVSVS